jgi:hypothetical protein
MGVWLRVANSLVPDETVKICELTMSNGSEIRQGYPLLTQASTIHRARTSRGSLYQERDPMVINLLQPHPFLLNSGSGIRKVIQSDPYIQVVYNLKLHKDINLLVKKDDKPSANSCSTNDLTLGFQEDGCL